MNSWVALSRSDHAKSHWQARNGYEHAARMQVIPILLAELAKLVPHYVLGFVKNNDDSYQAAALVGLGGDRNVYVTNDAKWLCDYIPAGIRGYPFSLYYNDDGKSIICIEESHLSADPGLPRLFKDNGELETEAAEILNFVNQRDANRQVTDKAVADLADTGLIEPWPISIGRGEGQEPLSISGFYRISEDKLNNTAALSFTRLRKSGALPLAYAQLFSMAQLGQLTTRAEYLLNNSQQQTPLSELSGLFSEDTSGSLNFDAFDLNDIETENK
jgi:hypothetical protein